MVDVPLGVFVLQCGYRDTSFCSRLATRIAVSDVVESLLGFFTPSVHCLTTHVKNPHHVFDTKNFWCHGCLLFVGGNRYSVLQLEANIMFAEKCYCSGEKTLRGSEKCVHFTDVGTEVKCPFLKACFVY